MESSTQVIDKIALVEHYIHWIRNEKVILDFHIARLYGVETRIVIQAVKRNIERFPDDFVFQLTDKEEDFLGSQNVIPKLTHQHISTPQIRQHRRRDFTGISPLSMLRHRLRTPRNISSRQDTANLR